jgi:hypothetical protein
MSCSAKLVPVPTQGTNGAMHRLLYSRKQSFWNCVVKSIKEKINAQESIKRLGKYDQIRAIR